MKITVRKHHQQLITNMALEMGCSPSEALNYILWQYRWGTPQPPQLQPLESPTKQLTLASPKAIAQFEQTQLQQEIDPIINKIAGLIEDF
ncbi:hypothetical protein NIES25_70020 (plasmid) [Nostoc linckia NIES-25]|nr:hypothetical protein NIES25_70020 [Nostoc linckia NIES-25]